MFAARRARRPAALRGPETRPTSLFRADRWWWYVSQERYPVLWIGQVAVVTLPVEIDVTNADAVVEELFAVLNQSAALLVADMSKTNFCDSSGVSALVRAFRRADASGQAMRFVVSTPHVQRPLALTDVGAHVGAAF